MKKLCSLALAFVLTAALFTGCGCTNSNRGNASTPTGMTEPMQTTIPTTRPTVPTTQATRPTVEETTPTGNGAMEDETSGTTDATESTLESRARGVIPGGTTNNSRTGR